MTGRHVFAILALSCIAMGQTLYIAPAHYDKPVHDKFWDTETKISIPVYTMEVGYDLYTTRHLIGKGQVEVNPLARPFVNSNASTAAFGAGNVGLMIGLNYLLHRTHHDKARHWLSRISLSVEGASDINQCRHMHQ